jgi:hypothetical protein
LGFKLATQLINKALQDLIKIKIILKFLEKELEIFGNSFEKQKGQAQ